MITSIFVRLKQKEKVFKEKHFKYHWISKISHPAVQLTLVKLPFILKILFFSNSNLFLSFDAKSSSLYISK